MLTLVLHFPTLVLAYPSAVHTALHFDHIEYIDNTPVLELLDCFGKSLPSCCYETAGCLYTRRRACRQRLLANNALYMPPTTHKQTLYTYT